MNHQPDPMDCPDIPAFLDRRGEPTKRPSTTALKRHWIMPTPARLAAAKRKRDKENRAIARATERDLSAFNAMAAPVDQAADLQRVVRGPGQQTQARG